MFSMAREYWYLMRVTYIVYLKLYIIFVPYVCTLCFVPHVCTLCFVPYVCTLCVVPYICTLCFVPYVCTLSCTLYLYLMLCTLYFYLICLPYVCTLCVNLVLCTLCLVWQENSSTVVPWQANIITILFVPYTYQTLSISYNSYNTGVFLGC